jgi:hypothetical protein
MAKADTHFEQVPLKVVKKIAVKDADKPPVVRPPRGGR